MVASCHAPRLESTPTKGCSVQNQPVHIVDAAQAEDLQFYSVTSILGVLDKPALIHWAANEAAIFAVDRLDYLATIIEQDGRDEAIKKVADARFSAGKGRRTASALGSAAHEAIEYYTTITPGEWRPGDIDDIELAPMLRAFDVWCNEFQPEFIGSEIVVINEKYRYAGQADVLPMKIEGVTCIADFKTSRKSRDGRGNPTKPYPSQVALQLAAYRAATSALTGQPTRKIEGRGASPRIYLANPTEMGFGEKVPEVDTGLVIHITPEVCRGYPIVCDDQVFDYFLHTLEAYRWVHDVSPAMMSAPVVTPR